MTTKQLTIRDRLASDAFKAALAEVLPDHVTPDRMARMAIAAISRTPELANCDQHSFFRCMMDLSQWGLEPDGRRAHLIPFNNRRRGVVECTLILDYKGLVELAYRSGVVARIHADVVHTGDLFGYDLGEVQKHVPWFLRNDADKPEQQGDVFAVYCVVTFKDGANKTEVLSFDEVEAIRKRSRAGSKGPWVTDWAEMAKKTAFKRVSKWLPLSADIRDAMEKDHDRFDSIDAVAKPKATSGADFVAALQAPQQADEDGEPVNYVEGVNLGYHAAIADAVTVEAVQDVLFLSDKDAGLPPDAKDDIAQAAKAKLAEMETF